MEDIWKLQALRCILQVLQYKLQDLQHKILRVLEKKSALYNCFLMTYRLSDQYR